MTDREDKVYKAKLAEQAERYDGRCPGKCDVYTRQNHELV